MALKFIPVQTGAEIETLADLAKVVWNEFFVSIITPEQINYMVDQFQSVPALTDQIGNQGYEYFFINWDGVKIGYTGIKPDTPKLFLSKLYLLKEYRGRGYASATFAFLENLCVNRRLEAIWLTVNRNNKDSIAVYEKKGFKVVRTQVKDIGNGYVMDDYVMEKVLAGCGNPGFWL
ncbi:MAG TPA: GNAT family N-acetyltransferase [Bacillota bacterium]|nr:GNAT family N-acetyltransferase [Bacillota bacterium]